MNPTLPSALPHEVLLASLPARTRVALHERSDAAGLVHLAGHAGAIGITGVAITLGVPGWQLLLPVHGVLLVFLFTLQHECTHRSPFASALLNDIFGHVTGFLLFQPFLWFRHFHLAHHRHTNDPDRDPELLSGAKPVTRRAFALYTSGVPIWIGAARRLFRNAFGPLREPYLPERAKPRLRHEARAMLAGYVLVFWAFGPMLLWLWLIPLLLGQPALRLYLLAEHGRCPQVANMLENTRTVFTTRLIRALAWNMPYHIEHHCAPNVPFFRLPDLHREIRDHLVTTAPGYSAFTRNYVRELDG